MSATFLPLLDNGDLIYMNASVHSKKHDIVFHSALGFITGCSYQTHHFMLYNKVELPSLYMRRSFNWYRFIYNSIYGYLHLICLSAYPIHSPATLLVTPC